MEVFSGALTRRESLRGMSVHPFLEGSFRFNSVERLEYVVYVYAVCVCVCICVYVWVCVSIVVHHIPFVEASQRSFRYFLQFIIVSLSSKSLRSRCMPVQ